MLNLAGRSDCDQYIEGELRRCRIIPHRVALGNTEVPYTLEGRLGPYRFRRAWYYWVVSGPVPLTVAQELYADPVGREDVRVDGHCGCPPPEDPWLEHAADGTVSVALYHIDSEIGLRLFVDTLRAHGLTEEEA